MMRFYLYFRLISLLIGVGEGSGGIAQNLDIDLLKKINHSSAMFNTEFCCANARTITFVNIAAPISVFTAGIIKHDKKMQLYAAYMAGAYLGSSIITHGLKNTVKRERPFEKYSFIVKRDVGGSYSFPSGHTSAAFCTATSLSLYFRKWYVVVPSYVWASSIGYARMYQGVHYPSDVLAGAVVGAGSAWLAYKMQQWHDRKIRPRALFVKQPSL